MTTRTRSPRLVGAPGVCPGVKRGVLLPLWLWLEPRLGVLATATLGRSEGMLPPSPEPPPSLGGGPLRRTTDPMCATRRLGSVVARSRRRRSSAHRGREAGGGAGVCLEVFFKLV